MAAEDIKTNVFEPPDIMNKNMTMRCLPKHGSQWSYMYLAVNLMNLPSSMPMVGILKLEVSFCL